MNFWTCLGSPINYPLSVCPSVHLLPAFRKNSFPAENAGNMLGKTCFLAFSRDSIISFTQALQFVLVLLNLGALPLMWFNVYLVSTIISNTSFYFSVKMKINSGKFILFDGLLGDIDFQALILTVQTKGIEDYESVCWYCFVFLHSLDIF